MPFKKGQSGNPAGRKPTGFTVADAFRALGGKDGKLYAQELHRLAVGQHSDPNVRIKALGIIAPYVWGKPKDSLELSGAGGGPVVIRFVDVNA